MWAASVMGQNPAYGADINFYVKTGAKKIQITIASADGKISSNNRSQGWRETRP